VTLVPRADLGGLVVVLLVVIFIGLVAVEWLGPGPRGRR
jgi:hypothetical protein